MSVNLDLTDRQLRRLAEQKSILVKPDQIEKGEMKLEIKPLKYKKMMKNKDKEKGFKLFLTPDEMKGGNIKGFMEKLLTDVRNGVPIARKTKQRSGAWKEPQQAIVAQALDTTAQQQSSIPIKTSGGSLKQDLLQHDAEELGQRVGSVYFDSGTFIRPQHPAFIPKVRVIPPTNSWI
jgi:hypothetical protein